MVVAAVSVSRNATVLNIVAHRNKAHSEDKTNGAKKLGSYLNSESFREQAIQHSRELNGSSLLYLGSSHSARPHTPRSRSRGIAYPSRSIRYQLLGNRSGIRFACASKQDDAEQKRNNEWDRRDPDNEAGIGVPWRGESTRIGKVQTPDH